ncbi:regulator of chromosome condensation 1/beta-lactamase-inhibitor protein II [Cladochytrium replicatum]|nr:regulator of chromosome condensation 1/beta-lactamase-inhibitor protein II [Cladochytrium replicatum]
MFPQRFLSRSRQTLSLLSRHFVSLPVRFSENNVNSQSQHSQKNSRNDRPRPDDPYDPKWRSRGFLIGAGVALITIAVAANPGSLVFPRVHNDYQQPASGDNNDWSPEALKAQEQSVENARKNVGVFAWGRDDLGTPVELKFFKGKVFRDVSLGKELYAAVDKNGDLIQWTGASPIAPKSTPSVKLAGKNLIQVVIIGDQVYALAQNGSVYGCKASTDLKNTKFEPVKLDKKLDRIVSIAGGEQLVAITAKGEVLAISDSQLPILRKLPSWNPVWRAKEIASGSGHTLIRTSDGRVFGFGANVLGQLGIDLDLSASLAHVPKPTEIKSIHIQYKSSPKDPAPAKRTACKKIAAGGDTSFFLMEDLDSGETQLLSCGTGLYGQLGHGSYVHAQSRPVEVRHLSNLKMYDEKARKVVPIPIHSLSVSNSHCAASLGAVADDGSPRDVYVWGHNMFGQLRRADGKKGASNVPVNVKGIVYGAEGVEAGRLELAPRSKLTVGKGWFGDIKVQAEQQVVCGDDVTLVYWKAL